jgi:hypothetical protein
VDPKNAAISKLYRQYVLARVTDLRGVDVGHFDFDPDSTLYTFVINADEQILLRYGGRDDESAETYFNEKSLQLALERGLAQYRLAKEGKLEPEPRAPAKTPADYPDIKRDIIDKDKCVHCHNIGSAKTKLAQAAGKLDKQVDLWVYPEVLALGITLDPEKGTVIKKVEKAAKEAGLKAKDEIVRLAGKPVLTYGDLQQRLHLVPHDARTLELVVRRGDAEETVTLKLPEYWRVTKIERRGGTHALEPFPEFWGKELDEDAKRKLGLKKEDFACEVTKFWVRTNAQAAGLQVGDVVCAVDDVTKCPYTCNPVLWIRLNRNAGDTVKVKVLRGGKTFELSFKLKARPW